MTQRPFPGEVLPVDCRRKGEVVVLVALVRVLRSVVQELVVVEALPLESVDRARASLPRRTAALHFAASFRAFALRCSGLVDVRLWLHAEGFGTEPRMMSLLLELAARELVALCLPIFISDLLLGGSRLKQRSQQC